MLGYGREELLAEEQGRQSDKQRTSSQAQGAKYTDGVTDHVGQRAANWGRGRWGCQRIT